jgi:arylsulfatase A-like enzyme
MATGLSTRGHGLLENGYRLDEDLPTFMQVLQADGYRTAAFGKVHFRPHFETFWPEYEKYGFDEIHITEDGRGGEWLDWVGENYPEYYDDVLSTVWATHIPEFEAYGPDKVNLKERILKIRENKDWATEEFPLNTQEAMTLPFPKEVSQTEWISMHALDYLDRCDGSQPFFTQISYVQPHSPFTPPGDYMKDVNCDELPRPVAAEWKTDPNAPGYFKTAMIYNRKHEMYNRQCYFADLVHLDEQLGKVISKLKEKGFYDDTYIVFISDHGELLGDHGFYGKEERHYDACIRVPLIICGPGIVKGQVSDEIFQHEDFFPTILDMAGSKAPTMPKMGNYLQVEPEDIPILPGKSVLPICKGETARSFREEAYIESYNPIWSIHVGDWARTIRTKKYRYTYYPNKMGEQLFDLTVDPDEQHNLIKDPDYQQIKMDLKDRLLEKIILQDYPKTRRELYALGVH